MAVRSSCLKLRPRSWQPRRRRYTPASRKLTAVGRALLYDTSVGLQAAGAWCSALARRPVLYDMTDLTTDGQEVPGSPQEERTKRQKRCRGVQQGSLQGLAILHCSSSLILGRGSFSGFQSMSMRALAGRAAGDTQTSPCLSRPRGSAAPRFSRSCKAEVIYQSYAQQRQRLISEGSKF